MTGSRDPGLQQERTALAWNRTSLALVVGALVVARLSLKDLGPGVAVPATLACTMAIWVWLGAQRRSRMTREHPHDPRFSILRDGTLPAATASVVALLALGEMVAGIAALF